MQTPYNITNIACYLPTRPMKTFQRPEERNELCRFPLVSHRSPGLPASERGVGLPGKRLRGRVYWTNAGGDSWAERKDISLQSVAKAETRTKDELGEGLPERNYAHSSTQDTTEAYAAAPVKTTTNVHTLCGMHRRIVLCVFVQIVFQYNVITPGWFSTWFETFRHFHSMCN